MEGELTALAAERRTPEDLAAMATCLRKMEEAGGRLGVFQDADLEFHAAIWTAAHNRLLLTAAQLIRNMLREWSGETLRLPDTASKALRQHQEIYRGISDQDRNGARAAMDRHLDAMGKLLFQVRGGIPAQKR
jgi:GntR family transcriptional regulator, transcriptional repressor for pyruvate dehydrogenase complex